MSGPNGPTDPDNSGSSPSDRRDDAAQDTPKASGEFTPVDPHNPTTAAWGQSGQSAWPDGTVPQPPHQQQPHPQQAAPYGQGSFYDQYPQGQYAQGQYPQGQYAQGQYPQSQYPQEQYPQGQYGQQSGYPQGQNVQGQNEHGQYPTPQYPAGQPFGAYQYPGTSSPPTGVNQNPSAPQQYAPGQYGAGQYAPGQYAPGQYGAGQYAPGQYGAGPYGQQSQQSWNPDQQFAGQSTPGGSRTQSKKPLVITGVVVAVVAVVAVVSYLVFGRTTTLDSAAAQEGITKVVTESYGAIDVSGVSCPRDIEVKAGSSVDCTLTVDGAFKKVTLTFLDDDANYEVSLPK